MRTTQLIIRDEHGLRDASEAKGQAQSVAAIAYGADLKRRRKEHGLTQGDLAALIGLSTGLGHVSISRYESGVTTPNQKTKAAIEDVLSK